jgi:quinolinate synthase
MTTATCPVDLREAPAPELLERARAAREALGDRAIILGPHYQKDEVIRFADATGDSYRLARVGAEADAELIVFLGVYFMAEAADILSAPEQTVVLPDLSAGCFLAECADIYTVRDAWEQMARAVPGRRVIPITYMNSDAVLKAFVGEHGGLVCTSSNAERAFRWAYERGDAIFFFPDQHLGRNIGAALGIDPDLPPVWDPRQADLGGIDPERLRETPLILWKGHCNVHTTFTVPQIEAARAEDPDVHVIVHPECPRPVVEAADEYGSTDYIIRRCEELPAGASAVIGTDKNLVDRLGARHADKRIRCLNEHICPCVTMNRIDLPALTWALERLAAGEIVNPVRVDPEVAANARVALDRMLSLS